jgi:hypothetical protein
LGGYTLFDLLALGNDLTIYVQMMMVLVVTRSYHGY